MVLGKLPVLRRPTILITVSSGDGPILTEILSQRAVKPKTTNQPTLNTGCSENAFK